MNRVRPFFSLIGDVPEPAAQRQAQVRRQTSDSNL
ncbi:hypothetical protein FAES_1177 [Fibrella aestuarina BUZ 2]|uniref:Uncharacterized protein n=1 Tax=Fibrella aestuarina BUZ 2 TaxID=1166018 RepID=I0K4Y4_9BACT|nr:hypothetical protein FAES_1177 [Fibrella aestuarina BUZ 2]